MKEHHDLEKIMAYHEGRLSGAESEAFEREITLNKELNKEYQDYLATQEAIDLLQYQHLRGTIASFQRKPNKLFIVNSKVWALAAGVVLVIGASFFIFSAQKYSDGYLVGQYYVSPNFSENRSSNQKNKDELIEAQQAFNQINYSAAISILEDKKNSTADENSRLFIIGNAYLKNGSPEKAIVEFENLLKQADPRYVEQVEWSLALSYLENGDVDKCDALLNNIIEDDTHGFKSRAIELRNDLNHWLRSGAF